MFSIEMAARNEKEKPAKVKNLSGVLMIQKNGQYSCKRLYIGNLEPTAKDIEMSPRISMMLFCLFFLNITVDIAKMLIVAQNIVISVGISLYWNPFSNDLINPLFCRVNASKNVSA